MKKGRQARHRIPRNSCLNLHLSISNGFVSFKISDKRDDLDFDIVNFPFLEGTFPVLLLRCLHFSTHSIC